MASPSPSPNRPIADAGAELLASIANLVRRVTDNAVRLSSDVVRDAASIGRDSERLARAARAQWEVWQGAGRAAPRVARVIAEGAALIALYRFHLLRARLGGFDHVPDDVARMLAQRARAACVELRGGVLKLGQIASCRPDLVGPAWAHELSELQDRVPPVDSAAIVARVEAALGAPIAERFARFDLAPVAAASLAQVHLAGLPDGREVAVKVQVPGIDEVIDADVAALRALATVAGDLLPGADRFATELGAALRTELDYAAEAAAAREVAAQIAPPLFVPAVIDSHSSGAVITSERVDGARLGDHLAAADPAERARVIGAMIADFARAVFTHGVVHADPHPGNFLVCPDGRIAVLDFGCVLRLALEERRGYAQLLGQIFRGDPAGVAGALAALGFAGDRDALVALAGLICAAMKPGVAAAEIDWSAQMKQMIEEVGRLTRAGGVRVPPGFVLLGRVLATLAGYVVTYRPPLELFRLIAPQVAAAAGA